MTQHIKTQDRYSLCVAPANEISVRGALIETIKALQVLDLSSEEYGAIELVLAEVMNNIVEHAYEGISDGTIDLVLKPKTNGLHCTLIDKGHQMPDGHIPIGELTPHDCDICDLPEGGFGWFLIRDLARDLEYVRQGNKNVLTFRISTYSLQN